MNKKIWLISVLSLLVLLGVRGAAVAAERASDDNTYRIGADEQIDDDLYIAASEVYIEGTVDGDVLALANYVEIDGNITGDLLVIAGGVTINGTVGDDARLLVGGIDLAGDVGGDLILVAGGNSSFSVPLQLSSNVTIPQGVFLQADSVVGGDMLAWAGTADVAGLIKGDLETTSAGAQSVLSFSGEVKGNATIEAFSFDVGEGGQIDGALTYVAPERIAGAADLSDDVTYRPLISESEASDLLFQILLRMVSVMTGFAIVGWLLMSYAPSFVLVPAAYVQGQPFTAAWVGFLIALCFLFFPLITAILMFGVGLFWGVLPAVLLGMTIVCGLLLVWIFSPLVTGLYIGRRFSEQPLTALIIGSVILTVLFQLPLLGVLISALSFFAALGSLVLMGFASQVPAE